jgi:serine phosphatase RsbU (regulator of sigma subunit)
MGGRAPDVLSIAAFAPAPVFAIAAGMIGIATPIGILCSLAAVGWTVADLVAVEPRLRSRRGGAEDISTWFLRRAIKAANIEEIARDLQVALTTGLAPQGPGRALLIAPGPDGQIRTLGLVGPVPTLGDLGAALEWLGLVDEPLDRGQIEALISAPVEEGGGEGARAAIELLDACGCDVVLALRHRGLLLGVVLLARPPGRVADPQVLRLLRALRAYATAAVARTFLRAEVKQRGRLSRSVNLATAMQEAMMPVERPIRRPGFELRGLFRPVEECGGDFWMWRDLGDGKVLLLTADATGHGAAPALLAAVAKGTVDALCQLGGSAIDPAELLASLGRVVYRTGKRRYLMTAFAAVVDTASGVLTFANAGQNFPYLLRAPRDEATAPTIEPLIARGDTLGSAPRVRYETHRRGLEPGDRLFLYTDGVVDAGTPHRDPYGDKRLRAALVGAARERSTRIPELVLAELEAHTTGIAMGDDVTMLVFELSSSGGAA